MTSKQNPQFTSISYSFRTFFGSILHEILHQLIYTEKFVCIIGQKRRKTIYNVEVLGSFRVAALRKKDRDHGGF